MWRFWVRGVFGWREWSKDWLAALAGLAQHLRGKPRPRITRRPEPLPPQLGVLEERSMPGEALGTFVAAALAHKALGKAVAALEVGSPLTGHGDGSQASGQSHAAGEGKEPPRPISAVLWQPHRAEQAVADQAEPEQTTAAAQQRSSSGLPDGVDTLAGGSGNSAGSGSGAGTGASGPAGAAGAAGNGHATAPSEDNAGSNATAPASNSTPTSPGSTSQTTQDSSKSTPTDTKPPQGKPQSGNPGQGHPQQVKPPHLGTPSTGQAASGWPHGPTLGQPGKHNPRPLPPGPPPLPGRHGGTGLTGGWGLPVHHSGGLHAFDDPLGGTGGPPGGGDSGAGAFVAAKGVLFSGDIASFTGSSLDSYSVTILWGDGNSSTGTLSSSGGGVFIVSGSNTYMEEGPYPVAVQVTDLTSSTTQTLLSFGLVLPIQDDSQFQVASLTALSWDGPGTLRQRRLLLLADLDRQPHLGDADQSVGHQLVGLADAERLGELHGPGGGHGRPRLVRPGQLQRHRQRHGQPARHERGRRSQRLGQPQRDGDAGGGLERLRRRRHG
jgi:hypothetical protein